MINFNQYIEFYKKFEDVLSKIKEDGDIFNTKSFGKFEEILLKWLSLNDLSINKEDLRVLSTYSITKILKPEKYYNELRFLHEEIRLRNLVQKYTQLNSILDLILNMSNHFYKDPKKGFLNEHFLENILNLIGKDIDKSNIQNIIINIGANNLKDPDLKQILHKIQPNPIH